MYLLRQPDPMLREHIEHYWFVLDEARGRFGMYVPPVLEALGLVELEHNARNNRVRAVGG